MADRPLKATYASWVARLKASRGDDALDHAVGGEFEAFGVVEREMLRFYRPDAEYIIDVGCGSGRLAAPLGQTHRGRYLGTDIVPDLVERARARTGRPDWRFETVSGLAIPEADSSADIVCMFSVLTHLLHEQSYLYLRDAQRVLRPGGRIVFSFLEFAMESHWFVFADTIRDEENDRAHPLNVFIERGAIAAWAARLDLAVIDLRAGDEPFVPLPQPVTMEDGRVMEGFGNLGQSICVLERKPL